MYRPKFRPQYPDPTTTLDWSNCTMSSGAMALDFHTQGRVQMWGGQLRKLQSDQTGGTDIGDLKVAWSRLGYTLTDRRGKTWADLIVDLKSGRGVVLQGDYDVFTGGDTCQSSFDGDHAIYLNPEFFESNTQIAVADPLCKGFKRISAKALRAYAEKLGRRSFDTPAAGGGVRILYAVTRAWPVIPLPDTSTGGTDVGLKFEPQAGGDGRVVYTKDAHMWNVFTKKQVQVKAGFERASYSAVRYLNGTWKPGFLVTYKDEAYVVPSVYVKFTPAPNPLTPTVVKQEAAIKRLESRIRAIRAKVMTVAKDVADD